MVEATRGREFLSKNFGILCELDDSEMISGF